MLAEEDLFLRKIDRSTQELDVFREELKDIRARLLEAKSREEALQAVRSRSLPTTVCPATKPVAELATNPSNLATNSATNPTTHLRSNDNSDQPPQDED